jgi:glycosyltransferase involved in cell wall biosynthesis
VRNDAPLLLDVTRLVWRRWEGRQPTGIDRVCLAYLDRYRGEAQAVVQHRRIRRILDEKDSVVLFEMLAEPARAFRHSLIRAATRFGLRDSCDGRNRLYLNLGHTGLNDPGLREWLRKTDVRPVYFVHDLIPITHPEFCRAGEKAKHEQRMRTVLGSAAGVIANSRATLDDLTAFARRAGLADPPAVAALLGSDAIAQPEVSAVKPSHPTFVMLGTIEARKNHLMLLYVWTRLVQRLASNAPRLLVIGQRGWESEQAVDLLERSELLKVAVTEIGACDDEALAGHLVGARALLFPSLVEGYGLPLVEALRSGTPVIASDLPVFREIAGDVPDYLDALDGPAWERSIVSYAAEESVARAGQLERLAQYDPPTWSDHFETVGSWLARL